MEKPYDQVEDKLCKLLFFLQQLTAKLEILSDEIDNENLRNALCAVANESNQYASELNCQLKSWSVVPASALNNLEDKIIENSLNNNPREKGIELSSICERSEAFFSELYNDLINDYFTNTPLKNMMHYQLHGIKSAFMRIRFLNSLRFNG